MSEQIEFEQEQVDDGKDIDFGFDGEDHDEAGSERAERSTATPCAFTTGVAGSGKSYSIMRKLDENPYFALLAASTGIAAVNLNTVTIHSTLGFFDTNSLRDAYLQGSAQRKLRRIHGEGYDNVVIDEVSMISHDTLDLIHKVFDDVNSNLGHDEDPIGLHLVGDMCQLPPIADRKPGQRGGKIPWAFDAQCWHKFEANTTRLTKVWRQSDERFLAALNYARCGRGSDMVGVLDSCGVGFEGGVDLEFDGTTIVSKNDEVDRFNTLALDRVKGRKISLPARRWGRTRTEWKNIPDQTIIREGAYVMLLANKYADPTNIIYANGDCGHVVGITIPAQLGQMPTVQVKLVRNDLVVDVGPILRAQDFKDKPDDMRQEGDSDGGYLAKPHYNRADKRFVIGQCQYYPIRLAYASTVHKIQGISVDRVQIDARSWAFSSPAMVYVALSRCRSMPGLRLVGMKEKWAAQCRIDERIKRWL